MLELPLFAAAIASLVNSTFSSRDLACSIASKAVIILVVLAGYHFLFSFLPNSIVPVARSITTPSFAFIDGHLGQDELFSASTAFIFKPENRLTIIKISAKLLFIYKFFINFSKLFVKNNYYLIFNHRNGAISRGNYKRENHLTIPYICCKNSLAIRKQVKCEVIMRLRNVPGSREDIANSEFVIQNPEKHKGKIVSLFPSKQPLFIEIGMGKGQFITTLAKNNPDINYIGIEKYSSVLVRAIEKQTEPELPNLKFIRMDAENINDVFAENEVDGIYLNFSDPWPKDRHAKRRLTSRQFFARYEKLLKPEGKIQFKTDNSALFDFSLEEVEATNFKANEVSYDLHNSEWNEGNVMTEYEERFSAKGNPIKRVVFVRR